MSSYSKSLLALVVADDDERAHVLEQGLIDSHRVITERILITADSEQRIAAIQPDVIMIDLGNPQSAALERMLEIARRADRPVAVFVEGVDREATQRAADDGGAAYVVAGLRRERIAAVLHVAIARYNTYSKLTSEFGAQKEADDNHVIEQAKSFLVARKGLAEDEAFALMQRAATNQGLRVAHIARSLVSAAHLASRTALR
jgi:two-component system, response regulator / RNA-binding antiterminator